MNPPFRLPARLPLFYSRVSTDHQDNSLEVQLKKARAYCTGKGLELDDAYIYSDSDASGSIPFPDRPGGQLVVNTIKLQEKIGRPVTDLIIAKLDRFVRSVLDFEHQMRWLKEHNVAIHIVDLGGDSVSTQGPVGEFFLRILVSFAELERHMIRDRAQQVMDHKRAQGFLLNHCPYGWDTEETGATNPKTGKPVCRLVPNVAEQAALLEMHTLRQRGLSYGKIATQLNRAGVRTKTGAGRWQSGNVAHVLTSTYTRDFLADQQQPLAA